MKRIICATLVFALLLSALSGCGEPVATASAAPTQASASVSEPSGDSAASAEDAAYSEPAVDMSSGQAKLLKRLESAYNEQDIYAMIECFDPGVTKAFYAMAKLFGVNADAMQSIMPFASKALGQSGAVDNDYWGSVELTPTALSENGSTGNIEYTVLITYSNGTTREIEDSVATVKIDGEWYFSAFQPYGQTDTSPEPIPVNWEITDEDVQGELYTYGSEFYGPVGCMNADAKEVVYPFFRSMKKFQGDYCAVLYNGLGWGIIDKRGNLVIDYRFSDVKDKAPNGFFAVNNGTSWGMINPGTGEAISCSYQDIGCMGDNGLVPVKKDGYWGVIDKDENVVVDYLYTDMGEQFIGGHIGAAVNNAWGIIDSKGERVVSMDEANLSVIMLPGGAALVKRFKNRDDSTKCSLFYDPQMKLLYDDVYEDGVYVLSEKRFVLRRNTGDGGQYLRGDQWWRWTLLNEKCETVADSFDIAESFIPAWSEYKPGERYELDFVVGEMFGYRGTNMVIPVHLMYNQPMNYLDVETGRLLLPEWVKGSEAKLSYLFGGTMLVHSTPWTGADIYDLKTGTLLKHFDFQVSEAVNIGNYILLCTPEYGVNYLVDYSSGSFDDMTQYKELTFFSWEKGDAPYTAIVSDGVFYGVLTADGLLDKGVNYTKAEYDADYRSFTLEYGAKRSVSRVKKSGEVAYIVEL